MTKYFFTLLLAIGVNTSIHANIILIHPIASVDSNDWCYGDTLRICVDPQSGIGMGASQASIHNNISNTTDNFVLINNGVDTDCHDHIYLQGDDVFSIPGVTMVNSHWEDPNWVKPTCNNITSINNRIVKSYISLYPNPSDKILFIKTQALGKIKSLTVTNILGETMLEMQNCNLPNQISIENFPNGIYILTVNNEDKLYTEKFMKK